MASTNTKWVWTLCVLVTLSNVASGCNDCPFVPIPHCSQNYTVQAGDTLTSIAQNYHLQNAADLVPLNTGLHIDEAIFANNTLCVCGANGCPNPLANCSNIYTVKANDTCDSIAIAHDEQGVNPGDKLVSLNQQLFQVALDCANLKAGTQLCVDCYLTGTTTTLPSPSNSPAASASPVPPILYSPTVPSPTPSPVVSADPLPAPSPVASADPSPVAASNPQTAILSATGAPAPRCCEKRKRRNRRV
ncbi:hypothetical protein SmJEL517_g04497 [Synchytrium microbalum]|uniref:LysM domain-containing protein n=1 Tax=Synchytrium microbalum TaxID=1806994 RepID=A0A507BRP8_9FUNG|nr:uncharacterized protein SmJEL517_g04497 [Synchytrium microbalum]TPX32350.1 hypothetical protein SmJEL517_g04497 [Synchytrium microbalum]